MLDILRDPARRPAIVYAPTRKHAEELAAQLAKQKTRAAAYHAGLVAPTRSAIQTEFLDGRLDVVVATIAFGMGIDKANVRSVLHTALPGTLEAYYQEIGRAGRDGSPSRAVLFHSFADTKTHEFFLERDYPSAEVIARVFESVPRRPAARDDLRVPKGVNREVFDKAIEKLWLHGALTIDSDDHVTRTDVDYRPTYEKQRAHRRDQLSRMRRYAETPSCRMLQIVGHFGDRQDEGATCGSCDVCAPHEVSASKQRSANATELEWAAQIERALRERDGVSLGQLHRDHFASIERAVFGRLLAALSRAGRVKVVGDSFEKAGETIHFQRVFRGTEAAGDLSFIEVGELSRATQTGRAAKVGVPRPHRRRAEPRSKAKRAEDQAPRERQRRERPFERRAHSGGGRAQSVAPGRIEA